MLKQIIALAGFLILYLFVIYQAHQLILLFYIFFPFLLVPVAFYMLNEARPLFFATTVAIGLILGFFLVKHPSLEMILFGFLMIAFLFGLSIYYRRWKGLLKEEETREHSALHVLEILKQKHDSRMDSLKHLEKQVSGLLNLFEIARDFNESLSFDEMADLLYKVVKVELPFARMVLLFQEKVEDGTLTSCSYCICAEGVQKGEDVVTESEKRVIREMRDPKPMWQHEGKWFFSLSTQGIVRAYLIVEGANPDDLAKFEVLGAYLTLQVKKVRLYEIVKELSIRDGLTGVFVRRHFLERFQEELRRSVKFGLPCAVLMLDIDHFKRYNDEYGHLAGDTTLKQVADHLKGSLRRVDIIARYGGEEFMIVSPETRSEGALDVAERIRSGIARQNFKIYNQQTRVTVSIGVTLFPDDLRETMSSDEAAKVAFELIRHADRALYRAKEEGRNRVVMFRDL